MSRTHARCLIACLPVLLLTGQLHASQVFFGQLETPNLVQSQPASIMLVSGGHILPDGDPQMPTSPGGIVLQRSVIGMTAATPGGYNESYDTIYSNALTELWNGAKYRYLTNNGQLVLTGNPALPTEKSDGNFQIIASGTQANFDEAQLSGGPEQTAPSAATLFRTAIRINPLAPAPYAGLMQTYRERMIAKLAMAYQHYVDSHRFRLLPGSDQIYPIVAPGNSGSALARQRAGLTDARTLLAEGLDIFAELASDPVEGVYLHPIAPFGIFGGGASEEASRMFETYVRTLSLAIEVEEQLQRLDYFQNYGNPLAGTANAGPPKTGPGSTAQVLARADFYDDYAALFAAFSHLESYAYASINRVRGGVDRLRTFAADIQLAKLTFATGESQNNLGSQRRFFESSFSPNYVPFLTAQLAGAPDPNGRTYSNMRWLAEQAIAKALTDENEAKDAAEQVIQNEAALQERAWKSLVDYNGRLIELCGSVTVDGSPAPDLQGYLFPPDIRLEVTGRQGSGAILAQYQRIAIQQTRYDKAVAALSALVERIKITEEGAIERAEISLATGQRLAHVYTSFGEEFALFDKALADEQAETERSVARAQANAHKRSFWSKLGGVMKSIALPVAGAVASIAITAATLGAGAPAAAALATATTAAWVGAGASATVGVINEVDGWGLSTPPPMAELRQGWSGYNKQGKAILEAGELRARSTARIGLITQQQTRLRAAENATVAMINAEGQAQLGLAGAREEIRKLYVEFEQAKLDILQAEQELDLAELELVNLFDRVSYLFDEYQEAVRMVAESPLNRPDFRYVRDYRLDQSERSFRNAQMWTYLALKSAQYRFMTEGSFDNISQLIQIALRCRNATELDDRVWHSPSPPGLTTLEAGFYLSNGFPNQGETKRIVFSLKDDYYMSNFYTLSASGATQYTVRQELPLRYGTTPNQAIDTYFTEILTNSITGLSENKPVLTLEFSTSFAPREDNPLHRAMQAQLGHVILSSNSGEIRKGVIVNIRGTGVPTGPYQVTLRQTGTTYLLHKSRNNLNAWSGTGFPVRTWALPDRNANITAHVGKNMNPSSGSSAWFDVAVNAVTLFDERSPYSDRWQLVIDGSSDTFNRQLLTTHLSSIRDIQIGFTTVGFDPQ